jgi:hypothetical protein
VNGLAGRRFIESSLYQEARKAGYFQSGHPFPVEINAVSVLETAELIAAMRLRTFDPMLYFDIEGVPYVGEQPGAALVHGYVETIPTERLQIEEATEVSEVIPATSVPVGTPLPQGDLEFGGSTPTLKGLDRFGVAQPVTLGVLDDPGEVEALINRRLEYGVGIGLDNDLLLGNNSWTGMLASVTAANTVAVSGGAGQYRSTAVRSAVGLVQANGWYARKLQVVMHPVTLAALWEEEDGSYRPLAIMEMFKDSVDAFIPSNKMTIGEALVGDLFASTALFVKGPLEIDLSLENNDNFTRSIVTMKLAFRARSWVRQPGALALVTGIPAAGLTP